MEGAEKMVGGEKELQQKQQQQEWQTQDLLEFLHIPPLLIHVALVLFVGWICSRWKCNLLFVFTLGFAYICYIENRQRQKIEAMIRSDERKATDRKRLLSDAETARWLNSVVKSVWPIFLEKFASEEFLMRLAPWFLEKYKPWTAKRVVLQKLYLGKTPPVFTRFRAGRNPTDGDHLVLEMTMNLAASNDMYAAIAVQIRKRLGFGISTSFHISNIQVEGNLKVGIRFAKGWPLIERLRICFSDAPIIRMVAKPVFTRGVDVTDLPGIAAWLDKMIVDALEQSLVEPNMLVVDVPKLVGEMMAVYAKLKKMKSPIVDATAAGDWFHCGVKGSVGTILVEILEGESMKACDPNGKADPYVNIVLGQAEEKTTIRRKTLQPKWHEQFRIPIVDWKSPLKFRVRDKDRFIDDEMGYKHMSIEEFRNGERHEMWLQLDGVKTGRLRVALTVEGIRTVDDNENKSLDSPQGADASKDVMTSAPGVIPTEDNDPSRSGSSGERWGSESDETPLKDEYQSVDVGVGQAGCVSIMEPGRHVVKERYSMECLRQQSRSRKAWSRREKEHGKSQRQDDELDDVQQDLANPAGGYEARRSKMSKMFNRRSIKDKGSFPRQDVSGELSPEANELVIYNVGDSGPSVHMKLQMNDEDVENLQASGLQDELDLVPEYHSIHGGEHLDEIPGENVDEVHAEDVDQMHGDDVDQIHGEDEDGCEEPDKHKMATSRMKQMGKGVMKQAGKTAHNISNAFTRSHTR